MKKALGWTALLLGSLAFISPQANLGLAELKWLARGSFPGEILLGVVLLGIAYLLIGTIPSDVAAAHSKFREK